MRAKLLSIALIAPLLHVAPSAAQTPDLADLVGARAAGGETQLEARGYTAVTTNTVRGTKWSFWWNERMRACVQVATTEGRYATIQRVPDANCRQVATTLPSGPVRPIELPSRPDYDDRPGNGDRFGPSITLVCFGGGSGPAMQYQSGYVYNSRSHRFEPQSGAVLGRDGFASDVQIEIWHGRGRIHLEGKLVSPIHSGGDNGW